MQILRIKSLSDNTLCNCLLGIFSPFKHELPEYKGYNITIFKDKIRFLEVILNRGGSAGGLVALFFDGAVCDWVELPRPDDKRALEKVYEYIKKLEHPVVSKTFFSLFKSVYNIKKLFKK